MGGRPVLVLVAVAMLFFILTCSAVGIRLLWRAARSHEAPELYCGLGFAAIGLVGYPASLMSGNGVATIGEMWTSAYVVGMVFTNAGIAAFYLFTWQVFRRTRAAAGVVAIACLCLAIGSIGAIWTVMHANPSLGSMAVTARWNLVLQAACVGAFGWTTWEGIAQARMARRRLDLGLSDAITVNRFWLWSAFGGSTMVITLAFVASQLLGRASAEDPFVHLVTAVFGGISSVAMALAFFPPAAYTRWLRA